MLTQLQNYLALVARIWQAPGNRGHRVRALLRSLGWLLNKHTLRRPWTLRVFDQMRLRCQPEGIIALHVIQRSEWFDAEVSRFIAGYLMPGDTFVDVGANIGLYTLLGSQLVGRTGNVLAVEPSPVNGRLLRENLQLNGNPANVTLAACALAAEAGELAFNDADALAHALVGEAASTTTLRVPAVRFEAIDPGGEIALMKIDVEGFELEVLRGAEAAVSAGRVPVILFEMNNSLLNYGLQAEDIFTHLRTRGYTLARYEPETNRIRTDMELFGELLAYNEKGRDLIDERLSPTMP